MEVLQNWSEMDADCKEMQSMNFDPASPGYIHCSAENYNGSFHCSWTRTTVRSTARVLLVKAKRWGDDYQSWWPANVGTPLLIHLHVSTSGTRTKSHVSWMLTDQGWPVRTPTARTKKSSTASPSHCTYTATPAWRPTPWISTWETLVSDIVYMVEGFCV